MASPPLTSAHQYNRLSDDARRKHVVDSPFVWDVARHLDYTRRSEEGGRPNQYPLWVFFLWLILIHEYGSSRRVEEALQDQLHGPWAQIRFAAIREFGHERPHLVPPQAPPSRNAFNYALKHHLPTNTGLLSTLVRGRSRRLAVTMGLGTTDAPGSTSRPDRHRVAYGDVTVMTVRTRRLAKDAREADRTTGEVRVRRHDPDAALHTTGGGAITPGLAFAFTHLRGPNRNQQVILAVDPVQPTGPTEGHLVVDQYLEAAHHLPGLVGYAYDRALRGVHLNRLLKAGHIGLVGNHRNKGQTNDRYHGTETHHLPDGSTREVEIHLVGGAPHIRTFDVNGNEHLQPLKRIRINKRYNKSTNTFRMSAEYQVPAPDQESGGYLRIRLDETAEDLIRGYNRPEHLRAFPESDPTYVNVQKPLRASAESANRAIDDHHPRERLHHFGYETSHLSMLAWQAYRNGQTEAIFAPQQVTPDTGKVPIPA